MRRFPERLLARLWKGALPLLLGATPVAAEPLTLDPVTVGARYLDEVAEQVPLSLSTLDGETLDEQGMHRLKDIQQLAPGLVVSGHSARYMGLGLRGFGATAYNDGLDGSVGVFVDGVYQGRPGMVFSELLDVERIEVLRGPQGTLFGKNTTAGALNITTRAPTQTPEGTAETRFGGDGLREYRGSLSGPLLPGVLAGRLSAFDNARDGQVENLYNGESINDIGSRGLRGQLLWTPGDTFSARLIGEYGRQREDGNALSPAHYSEQTRQRAAFMNYALPAIDPYAREVTQNQPVRSSSLQSGVSLQTDWELSESLRLTSISAYRRWDFHDRRDGDSTALSVAQAGSELDHRQFSQELRLAGELSERMDFVLGAHYLQQRLDRRSEVAFGEDAAAFFAGDQLGAIGGPPFNLPISDPAQIPAELLDGARQHFDGRQRGRSGALFGQFSWRPLEKIEATLGLRYDRERKDGWISRKVDGLASLEGLPPPLQLGGQLLRDIALGGDYYREDAVDEGDLSGLFGLSYRFSDGLLGYASLSRGYKAGGINFDVIGPNSQPTFGTERATSLEAGVKARFWDGRALLGVAVYQTDVDDYQALTYSAPATPFAPPLRDNLINVGKVRLRGVEVDSSWLLRPRLELRLGLAWSDARYRKFANAPCAPASAQWSCDRSGERLYNAPEWNLSAGLDYSHPLVAGLEAYGGVSHSLRTGYYGTLEGGEGSYQPSYSLTDLRLGLRRADRRWEVEGWVRNLFDRHYVTAVYSLLGAGDYGVLVGDPRSAGMSVRVRL
ncbi:TonB-dependent receptor [Pseudomonas sp.]|uniref:TonB-dependent receptor n=1 Tax=Pseudomonas sp. TaxID=306 RepID=UPI0028A85E57|nr:TonB-dependent receptor [Pseudomonas sp.]